MVYGHANGSTVDDTVEAVGRYASMGYKAIRAQCRVPGLEHSYGVGRGDMYYEPAEKGLPPETRWSSERYLTFVPSLFERLRQEFGPDVHLLHDVHHRLTPIEAGAARQEPRAVSPVLARGSDAGRGAGALPPDPPAHDHAAGGRRGVQLDPRLLAADQRAADRLHPHDGRARRRHQPPAEDRDAGRAVPGAHRLARRDRPQPGVHGGGAALRSQRPQLRHPGIHAAHRRDRSRVPARLHVSTTASCIPATRRDLGVDIDETLAATFPYERAYLPVNRLLDGTMHSW